MSIHVTSLVPYEIKVFRVFYAIFPYDEISKSQGIKKKERIPSKTYRQQPKKFC